MKLRQSNWLFETEGYFSIHLSEKMQAKICLLTGKHKIQWDFDESHCWRCFECLDHSENGCDY